MSRDRAPQNSASSTHRRLFTDLQSVYQKIIQTSGPVVPLRSKDSKKYLHTVSAHLRNRQLLLSTDSVFTSRAPSAHDSSVEEIVIKPLRFHDRELLSSRSRRYSTAATPSSVSAMSADVRTSGASYCSARTETSNQSDSRLVRMRSKSSLSYNPIEYSEQSIRYVAEQVSLEQARQLKLRSNITQHRVDRRYFVSGSKLQMQNQAFGETRISPAQSKENKYSNAIVQHEPKTVLTLKPCYRRGLSINGKCFKGRTLHTSPLTGHSGIDSTDDVDEMSVPAVAVPTVVKLNIIIAPSDISTDSADETHMVNTDELSLSPT